MALTYYHAEPLANSLKSMIPLFEKGLPFKSVYVDLHKFEQHAPWFTAINPEGQVPALDHDGLIVTHTSVINEYLEDAFPDAPPLRPADPAGKARMRYWTKFADEHVFNQVSMHGWHRMVSEVARGIDEAAFEEIVARIPLHELRVKWRNARSGFAEADLAEAARKIAVAVDKVEARLAEAPWLAGDTYSLADINFYSVCGMMVDRLFPDLDVPNRAPRLIEWRARIDARPAVKTARAMPDRTSPALDRWSAQAG